MVITILQRRGGFPVFDYLISLLFAENDTENKLKIVVLTLTFMIFLLCAFRSFTSAIAVPFALATDSVDKTFVFPTRMKVAVSENLHFFKNILAKVKLS